MKFFRSLAFLSALMTPISASEFAPVIPFLEKYCIECHGEEKQEGKIRLDDALSIGADLWIDIYDQLEADEMPPFEADVHPPVVELEEMIRLIDKISRDERFTVATGYRRLNKREYRNTVRDLLGLNENKLFDPASFIYEDVVEEGFDTNSENLIITNELLIEYLRSAQTSLRTALNIDTQEPPAQKVTAYVPKELRVSGILTTKGKDRVVLRTGNGFVTVKDAEKAVTVSGNYRIQVTAAGVDRIEDNKFTRPNNVPPKGVPFQMAIAGSFKGQSKLYQEFDLKDEVFTTHEAVIWLDKGSIPQVIAVNGHGKPRNIQRHTPEEHRQPYPGVAVSEIVIEGPLALEWPPQTYRVTYNSDEMPDFEVAGERRKILNNFISRAFRRNVPSAEQEKFYRYLEEEYKKDQNWQEAMIRTFAVIMASTDFLYIKEDLGELNGFQLANRLSYFLWSTMPDMELFELAYSGDLLNPKIYRAQVRRMMRDPRTENFTESFASQWLSIDELGQMRPSEDERQYKVYFNERLEESMRQETLLYFQHVLFENLPITDFLDSDYTFLNEPLAELYDIPFEAGEDRRVMKLVRLPPKSVRGGLLGHASIHAVTSNGVETLPVTRGHWVLDELMGTPPPPAPEEVPALVPDLTGVDTPREQLKRHREDPKCFSCHQVMDPAGLALESFDIIGRYRTDYGKGSSRIDPSGKYLHTSFKDIRGLRKALLKQDSTFAINFIARIAEYGKGRELNRDDMDIVYQIARKAQREGFRFMTIMVDILNSDLILRR
ncbi:MAG: DUF1592 domain-containing protein [Roseibacillus sp.]